MCLRTWNDFSASVFFKVTNSTWQIFLLTHTWSVLVRIWICSVIHLKILILKYVSASVSIMIQFIVLKKLNFFRAFHFVSVRVQTFCVFKFFRTRLMYSSLLHTCEQAFPFWYDRGKEQIKGTQLCAINPFWQNHPFVAFKPRFSPFVLVSSEVHRNWIDVDVIHYCQAILLVKLQWEIMSLW